MKKIKSISVFLFVIILLSSCSQTITKEPEGGINASDSANVSAETSGEEAPDEISSEKTKKTKNVDRTGEDIYKSHPELTPVDYDSPALLPLSDDAGQEYIDKITFLCDSPFYWLKLYGLLSGGTDTTQVWTGPEGTMTLAYLRDFRIVDPFDKTERTIPETAALRKPPIMIITIGINGVSFMDEEYFKEEYKNLIDVIKEASPDTVIILQSILPISPAYKHWGSITNASITKANRWILELAEEYGLSYLDSFSCLLGENGNIRSELVMKDGLHANKDGLELVLKYIRTHAYTED
ncbi:MAG: hypothetical protein IJS90_08705 [Clostridia bacterium]|nr:hypothetical protein [Clostridia bacterium]